MNNMHDVYEYNSYVVWRVAVDGTASLQQGPRAAGAAKEPGLAWPKLLNMHVILLRCVG